MKTALLTLALIVFPVLVSAQAIRPVSVFVTSAGAMNGMTDPNKDNQNTVKDLREAVKDRKPLTLSDSRETADIVLIVMNREKAQVTAGMFGDPARDVIVRVTFIFKNAESEISASAQGGTLSSGGAWKRAAGKVASQVQDWVRTNRDAL